MFLQCSIMGLVTEDQEQIGAIRLCINYLMSDFHAHASVGVLRKVRAANYIDIRTTKPSE